MRTSSAATGISGGVEGSGSFGLFEKNFSKCLDGGLGVLHNLASLLLTNQTKRRSADL
jgi:hypothetical protein